MPSDEKQEGLVLRSLDYKDRQKILTLFTPSRGIISLIVKGISRKNTQLLTLTSPLTHAEYLYRINRGTLYTFQDGSALNTHLALRQSLPLIEAATQMVQALLTSQLPEKSAPALYKLTLAFLKLLPQCADPLSLAASFRLKLLKHDGVLCLASHCPHCLKPPTHLHHGEPFCQEHAPHPATSFTSEEWAILTTLLETRNPTTLQQLLLPTSLFQKITALFNTFFPMSPH